MPTQMKFSAIVVLGFAFTVGIRADIVYTNGPPDQNDALNLSEFIVADNFTLASAATVVDVTFWSSANVDPYPSQFSGNVGWGIFSDAGGTPAALLASGVNTSPALADTGVVILGTDEWTVSFSIPGLTLAPSTYWLGIHEGAFGSPDDGTDIYWDTTSMTTAYPAVISADLTGGGGWFVGDGSNLAFQLTGSAGSPAPEPSIQWPLVLGSIFMFCFRSKSRVKSLFEDILPDKLLHSNHPKRTTYSLLN